MVLGAWIETKGGRRADSVHSQDTSWAESVLLHGFSGLDVRNFTNLGVRISIDD